jgi:Sulfotransferase domain
VRSIRRLTSLTNAAKRKATNQRRALPDFIIIGAMKSGTTSLYEYLLAHPSVIGAARKEVHYFDWGYREPLAKYRASFPLEATLEERGAITGEATPSYLLFPGTAERIHQVLPDVRLIALLREPCARAFAHYEMAVEMGREQLSFREAIEQEEDRLAASWKLLDAGDDPEPAFRDLSYVERGQYGPQLAPWLERFGDDHVLAVDFRELEADPSALYEKVLRFLGLRTDVPFPEFKVHLRGPHRADVSEHRDWLAPRFEQSNEKLFALTGIDFRPAP